MSKPYSSRFPKNHPFVRELIKELKEKYGEKVVSEEDIIGIMKTRDGKIIWLENGDHTNRGLAHIIKEHLSQFEQKGIGKEILPIFILNVVAYGIIVGYQGKDRPIYEYKYSNKIYYVAVNISNNGFIVGANPKSKVSKKEKSRK